MLPVSNIQLFLLDMDGTLYLGDRLFPFAKELLTTIRAQGKHYLFMTNNSSKSVADYVKKLARLGVEAGEGDFITSAQATIHYLKEHHAYRHFYVGGTKSLLAEFAAMLEVVIQLGAILAVVCLFWERLFPFGKIRHNLVCA